MNKKSRKSALIIVAHPDDETLWVGGTILSHPAWHWFIVCLCRGSDADRAPKFHCALKELKSEGVMGNLDDGPAQVPLDPGEVEVAILDLLPEKHFDLIITHNPTGEYTRHLRHEEVSRAAIALWCAGNIFAGNLWTFAYEDGGKAYYPRPAENASVYHKLTKGIWMRKYSIITGTYGFDQESWEAKTTPKEEAFLTFTDPCHALSWLNQFEKPKTK